MNKGKAYQEFNIFSNSSIALLFFGRADIKYLLRFKPNSFWMQVIYTSQIRDNSNRSFLRDHPFAYST